MPAEAIDAEVEQVVRRIEALGDAGSTVVNIPTHAGRATEPAPYEVLGPAPPGERCVRCGKGNGVKRVKHGGGVDLLHEDCVKQYLAAMADPPVVVPDLGPDPLDEHGAPRRQTLCAPSPPPLDRHGEAQEGRICAQCRSDRRDDPPTVEVMGKRGERLWVHERGCLRFWLKENPQEKLHIETLGEGRGTVADFPDRAGGKMPDQPIKGQS